MKFLDVKSNVLTDMAKSIGVGPEQLQCKFCKTIVGGRLPNGEKNSFIFGVSKDHMRFIHGIHEEIAFYTKEGLICVCNECLKRIRDEIPEIFSSNDPPEPTKGGHFVTTFLVNTEGKHFKISRLQSDLKKFREIMKKLS